MPVQQISLQHALRQGHGILCAAHIVSNNSSDPSNGVQVSVIEKTLCYCYINIHPESIMILWIELTYILFEFRNQHVLNQIYIYAKVFTVRRSSFIFE